MNPDVSVYKKVGRYALLTVVLVILSVLQNTDGWFPAPFSLHAVLLIPAVCCVAMYETGIAALAFGTFAGLLWDFLCDGNNFCAIYLLIVAFLCNTLVSSVLRRNIITGFLLSTASLFVYFMIYWALHFALDAQSVNFYMLVRFYLPAFVYSVLVSPFVYQIVRLVQRKMKTEN